MLPKIRKLIYTGLGLGLLPKAPGTFGTFLGLLFFLALSFTSFLFHFIIFILISLIGLWATTYAEKDYEKHDSPEIVIDEVSGYLLTTLAFWLFKSEINNNIFLLKFTVISFISFRFFDILKPWPVGFIDRQLPGPLGVMADDWAAGIYAFIICFLVFKLFN